MWLLDYEPGSSSRESWDGAHGQPIQDRNILAAWLHPTLDIISPFGSWEWTTCGSSLSLMATLMAPLMGFSCCLS